MQPRTKKLLINAFNEDRLAIMYVDLQASDYDDWPKRTGSTYIAFENAEKLRTAFKNTNVENIWVTYPMFEKDDAELKTVEEYKALYDGTDSDFKIVSPNPSDNVFIKNDADAFTNQTLKSHIKDKQYKTVIMLGVQSNGCLQHSINGGMDFDPDMNIIVVTDGTNTGKTTKEQEREYLIQFLEKDQIIPYYMHHGEKYTGHIIDTTTQNLVDFANEMKYERG